MCAFDTIDHLTPTDPTPETTNAPQSKHRDHLAKRHADMTFALKLLLKVVNHFISPNILLLSLFHNPDIESFPIGKIYPSTRKI